MGNTTADYYKSAGKPVLGFYGSIKKDIKNTSMYNNFKEQNAKKNVIFEAFNIIFEYRYLIWILALKELKVRYRGSMLGFFWSMVNPLLLLLIYTFVFTVVFKSPQRAYPFYLFVGLMPFNWFSMAVGEAAISVVSSGYFVTKSTLPTEIVVLIKVVSNFINFALSIPIIFAFMVIFNIHLGLPLILFPLLIIIEFFITAGVGYFVGALQVFYRDMQHIVANLLQILFWSIPIVYFPSQIPEKMRKFIFLDPLAYLIKCYQDIFYFNTFPKWYYLIGLFVVSLIIYLLGYIYFHSHKEEFPELI